MKKSSKFLFFGLIMMGLILRVPFTSIPPILTDIAHGLHVSVNSLGTLTTIPLLMFAIFSPIAPQIARKFGIVRTFAGVLILLMVGSLLRIVNVSLLFIGTALIGIGIAMLNVLMPPAIMMYFPNKIGKLTAIYTTVMTCATALMSALAVPITQHSSWQMMIVILTVLLAVAFIIWLPNIKHEKTNQAIFSTADDEKINHQSAWRTPKAWIMLLFSGLQSLLFYTGLTWLPTMATEAGLSQTLAGNLSGIYSLIGIPFTLVLPAIIEAVSIRKRRLLMSFFNILGIIGIVMLFWQQSSFIYWLIISLLIGCATGALFPYLMTAFSLKATTPEHSAELSGMSQSGGYLVASIGPFLFGYGHTLCHSWTLVTACLLGLTVIMMVANILLEHEEKIY